MNPYRNEAWLRFREAVLQADEQACARCGRDEHDGAKLHVHHLRYLPGRLPWQYPLEMCETLCAGCHAAEHGEIPPGEGWSLVAEEDLGDLAGNCQFCGTDIRYVFTVAHPRWVSLNVGSDCCDRLTGTAQASEIERQRRNRAARRRAFVSSDRWLALNGSHRITYKDIDVRVFGYEPRYCLRIGGIHGRKHYATLDLAKLAAFDAIDSGVISRLQRRGIR